MRRVVGSRYSILQYFARPYKWLFAGIFVTTLVTALLEGLHVGAFFPVFHSLLGSGEGAVDTGFFSAMTALARAIPIYDPILSALMLLLGITVVKNCLMVLRETLVAYGSGTVQHDVRNRLMECYATAPYPFLLESKQGKLIYNISTGASRVGILTYKITQVLAEILKVIAIGSLLLITLPLAMGVLVVIGLAYYLLTHYLSKKISYHTGKGRVIAGGEQTTIADEFLRGIRHIITFGTHRTWLLRFSQHSRIFRDLYIKDSVWLAVPKGVLELSLVVVLSGFVLISRFVSPSMFTENLPLVGIFVMALLKALPSLATVGQFRMELLGLMGDAEGIYDVLTTVKARSTGGSRVFTSLQKGIVFDRVRFAYKDREELLNEVNVTFEKGKFTAIVGPSGSGKTTIVNVILGFFGPTGGRILVDDVDLTEYRLDTWRKRIGFVAQDPFIFHASVAENITFGRSGHSSQAVERAAQIANAHDFIMALPQGYDTVVGERGMKLSGGQQQRIAIARAVLDDPDILIFDEATTSLDAGSERLVQEAIDKISLERTVIVIAHRLATIRNADKVVVLDQGRIIEEGRHKDLITEQGRYFRLVAPGRE